MDTIARISGIDALGRTCGDLAVLCRKVEQQCTEELQKAKVLVQQTEQELLESQSLLQKADEEANQKRIALENARAAAASANPITMAAALEELYRAETEYATACARVSRLSLRVELAFRCNTLATEMYVTLATSFRIEQSKLVDAVRESTDRLHNAESHLSGYIGTQSLQADLPQPDSSPKEPDTQRTGPKEQRPEALENQKTKGGKMQVAKQKEEEEIAAAYAENWRCIGPLKTAELKPYNDCVGLYRHEINGEVMYVGRAIELQNGGFRKRLSDYRRPSDSARKHTSGRIINEHLPEITTYILIVGDTQEAVEETKKLEGVFVHKYDPPWNKMLKKSE